MHNLELLLRKYTNNFLLLDDIISNKKIEYLNFYNIITITDTDLIKVTAIKNCTRDLLMFKINVI